MMRPTAVRRVLAISATLAGVLVFGLACVASAAPTLEDQVYAIAKELMCPVCAGQTVAESSSQLAEQMRGTIRERLRAGQTREEIIAYFVSQFGEGVLAAPPARGSGLLLWLIPPLALGVGAIILQRFIRRNLSASR